MPRKTYPIERGLRSIVSEARSLAYSAGNLAHRDDKRLIAGVQEIARECYRLARQAQDFAEELRGLPRCTICGQMTDRENPHEECQAEAAEEAERLGKPLPAA